MGKRIARGLIVAALVALAGDAGAIIGRPLTPLSFAGVARRTARRSVYGAGAYGAGAYGAGVYGAPAVAGGGAVSELPAGCAPGVPCGGAVYAPAYQGTTVVYVPH